MKLPPDPHYRHQFSAAIISYAAWLYHVFSLSLRDDGLFLAERCILVRRGACSGRNLLSRRQAGHSSSVPHISHRQTWTSTQTLLGLGTPR